MSTEDKARFKIPAKLGSVLGWLVVLLFVVAELWLDYWYIKYPCYALIALYVALLVVRAYRNRKKIEFVFEKGTQEGLGERFAEANLVMREELDSLLKGYKIGFLQRFSKEFSKVDSAARYESNWLDSLIDFAEYAFPFQNIVVAVLSTNIQRFAGSRLFSVSITETDEHQFVLHANSRNDQTTPILVSKTSLHDCVREAAGRMYYELNASELTPSYRAFARFIEGMRIWSRVYYTKGSEDPDYEPATEQLRQALAEDSKFILATLYLGALNSMRRSRAVYFKRAKRRFESVVELCGDPSLPGSSESKRKIEGLALTLSCNLMNQWLHRFGRFEDEEKAKSLSDENRKNALHAITLLEDSALPLHEHAFSMHSMERSSFADAADRRAMLLDYASSIDEYTKAIEKAQEIGDGSQARRSVGNRAYVMMWLGAMLRQDPDSTITIATLGAGALGQVEASKRLLAMAETEMRGVVVSTKSLFSSYSVANLCVYYALVNQPGKFLHCSQLLCGVADQESVGSSLELRDLDPGEVATLEPSSLHYIEGANDICSGMLALVSAKTIDEQWERLWYERGLQFHRRSLELVIEVETEDESIKRIRLIKLMANLLKCINFVSPLANDRSHQHFESLNIKLNAYRASRLSDDELKSSWLADLESTIGAEIPAVRA